MKIVSDFAPALAKSLNLDEVSKRGSISEPATESKSKFSRTGGYETEASDQYQVATGPSGSSDHQDLQDQQRSSTTFNEVNDVEKNLDDVDPSLPLRIFLEKLVELNPEADARYNDGSPESWRSQAWFIARNCKVHAELEGLTAAAAWRKIVPLLRRNPDAQRQGLLDEDFSVDFMGSWEKVRILPGCEPLENALRRSAAEPISSGTDRGALYNRLISVAAYLQHSRGDMPIFLPVVKIGDALGVSHSTVSHLIRWAIEDNFLIVVEAHSFKHHRARSYRFRLERWKKFWKTKGL